MKAERKNFSKEIRTAELADLKQVLTADQYVKFLENNFINGKRADKPGKDGQRPGGPRPGNGVPCHDRPCQR